MERGSRDFQRKRERKKKMRVEAECRTMRERNSEPESEADDEINDIMYEMNVTNPFLKDMKFTFHILLKHS
jgi:hypothetical protein